MICAGSGSNIAFGDCGMINFQDGSTNIYRMSSLDPEDGDADIIDVGGGNMNIVIGGNSGDMITSGNGVDDILVGDIARLEFHLGTNLLSTLETFAPEAGGKDIIETGMCVCVSCGQWILPVS